MSLTKKTNKTRKTRPRPQPNAAADEFNAEFNVQLSDLLDKHEIAEQRAQILATLTEALGDEALARKAMARFRKVGKRYLKRGRT